MFGPKKDKRTKLEKEIDTLLAAMETVDRRSEEYKTMSESVEKLRKALSYDEPRKINPNTVLMVGANLVIVGAVICAEQAGFIIRSRAPQFIMKGRP